MTEKKAGLIQLDDDELPQTLAGLRQLLRKGSSLRQVIADRTVEISQHWRIDATLEAPFEKILYYSPRQPIAPTSGLAQRGLCRVPLCRS